MRMVLLNDSLDVSHFVHKVRIPFVPMGYLDSFAGLIPIDISGLKIGYHCEDECRKDFHCTANFGSKSRRGSNGGGRGFTGTRIMISATANK